MERGRKKGRGGLEGTDEDDSQEDSVNLALELVLVRVKTYGTNTLSDSPSLTILPNPTSLRNCFLLKDCFNVENKLREYELQYNKLSVKVSVLIIAWWSSYRLQ